jgi:glucosylceramidase
MRMKWIATSSTATWCGKVPQPTEASSQLSVTHHRQQTIDGFGGCFNEIGWRVLEALSEDRRTQILRDLFDPASGCGYRLCRVPIGANDYALEWYSHNECDGDLAMEHFSIARGHRYLIPYIRAAMSIQPDLRLFASPWSPPTWMKQPRVYNYGVLRWEPEILKAYALYLLRFVQVYQAEGLPVHQLHIQNEPDSDQKFPSCIWTGAKMRDFIRDYLGPRFRQTGVACEIWAGTIERPDYDAWAHTILVDPHARAFVSGVGYQWAGKGAVQRTHQSWPALRLLQTESECGDGTNTWDYAHYVFTQQTVTYNPEFYVMKHLAHFVAPGSVRLDLQGPWSGNANAFQTPDRSTVVVCANPFSEQAEVVIDVASERFFLRLDARSFNTIVLDG